jgi:hypothetical protein
MDHMHKFWKETTLMKLTKSLWMLSLIPLLAGLLIVGPWMPSQAQAQGNLHRLSAEFFAFDGEVSTSLAVPGQVFSTERLDVPDGDTVLYVSISAQADTHGGAALLLSCRVDGAFCNPGGSGGASGPPGWVTVLKLPVANSGASNCNDGGGGAADCHDNHIAATWCVPIKPGTRTIELRLATSIAGETVFMERGHIYIDSNDPFDPSGTCVPAHTSP